MDRGDDRDHWNPAKDWKHSDLDVVFINRPDAGDHVRNIPMSKLAFCALLALLLTGCASGKNSLPYDAWRLGFFAPDYMEVWIETADVIDNSGWGV